MALVHYTPNDKVKFALLSTRYTSKNIEAISYQLVFLHIPIILYFSLDNCVYILRLRILNIYIYIYIYIYIHIEQLCPSQGEAARGAANCLDFEAGAWGQRASVVIQGPRQAAQERYLGSNC